MTRGRWDKKAEKPGESNGPTGGKVKKEGPQWISNQEN